MNDSLLLTQQADVVVRRGDIRFVAINTCVESRHLLCNALSMNLVNGTCLHALEEAP